MSLLHVWKREWRQHRVFVLEIMSHTHGSTITNCCWAIEIFSPSQEELELVEEAKRYHLDIIGVSSTKRRGSGTVNLDGGWKLLYSGADPNMSAQAGVGILQAPCSQTVCQIGFLWDHGFVCWSSRYLIGHWAYCRYTVYAPMLRVNIMVLWMK